MNEVHIKKNNDYANDQNPFSNFEMSASLVSWFTDPIDQVFVALIGTKLSRLSELLTSGKTPNNESVDDTFLDLTNYCGLWAAYRLRKRELEDGNQISSSSDGQQGLHRGV